MSTYSNNLRIELITNGTQAGTWGDTTNTNLGTIIEDSIAGYTTVSVISANQAFTAVDGAADQARNAMIRLTTTTTANFAVYAPPVSKQYIILNDSAYTATIYNSTVIGNTTAAGLGVAIPAGKTMTVWSEGTDFNQQNTSLTSPALTGTPTAPTASPGTNTTQVATTAFVVSALQAVYPVGAIYMSTGSTNPGTTFGFGTWTQLAPGRMLMGAGGAYGAGTTGGSADATLPTHTHTFSGTTNSSTTGITINQAGEHQHTTNLPFVTTNQKYSGGGQGFFGEGTGTYYTSFAGLHQHSINDLGHDHGFSGTTASSGSSPTNANLPPYLVVYMWQRTA